MEDKVQIKLFFWIGTLIMIFLAVGIILMTVIYKARVDRLNRKKSESLLKASLNSEKRERQRIASDLHDGLSGDLGAVKNFITLLNNKEEDLSKKEILQEVYTVLTHALTNVQNISYNLMPPLLESYGLVPTLKSYFDRIKKSNSIIINQHYFSDVIEIPSSEAYEIYRIVQELTTNMIKHGKSQKISLSITLDQNTLLFEIIDDGISFDFNEKLQSSLGMGLKNISSRIKHIDAKLIQQTVSIGNKFQIILNSDNYVKSSDNR